MCVVWVWEVVISGWSGEEVKERWDDIERTNDREQKRQRNIK